jgi:hypothetical protein
MREINLDQNNTTVPRNTFIVYGDSRSGKTTWAATFPRPLFLSDVTEAGWNSITHMSDEQLFEPGVKPMVWGIEQMNDMALAREKAAPLIASGRVQTLVIDSLSFYCDLYLNYIVGQQTKKDQRAAFGDLGIHLRDLRVKTHSLAVNVVWLCLARHPSPEEPVGRPLVPGQQADKFMAGCDYVFYARSYREKRGADLLPPTFELRTRPWSNYVTGNRLGNMAESLPDPLIGTYEDMITHLGYDADEIRRSMPKLVTNGTPAKAAPASVPPPAARRPNPVPSRG